MKPSVIERLRVAGLRPTRQRVALGEIIFGQSDRHFTAEDLHDESLKAKIMVSLATVYNTLNQFTSSGILRAVAVNGAKTYFDTNTSNHQHFYDEKSGALLDIETDSLKVIGLPIPPEGTRISGIDVIVRLAPQE